MTDLKLRAACIHGRYEAHGFNYNPDVEERWQLCVGGSMVPSYEVGALLVVDDDGSIRKLERADWDDE